LADWYIAKMLQANVDKLVSLVLVTLLKNIKIYG